MKIRRSSSAQDSGPPEVLNGEDLPMTSSRPAVATSRSARSRGRSFGRGLRNGLLLELASILMLLAGLAHTGLAAAGTPQALSNNLLSVATSPAVRTAVATKLINQLQKDVGGPTAVVIAGNRVALVKAVENLLDDPVLKGMARADLISMYRAIVDAKSVTINLRPILLRLTAALHRVNPQIAASPGAFSNSVVTTTPGRVHLGFLHWLAPIEVILAGLAALLASLTAARFVERPRRKLWSLVFALLNPALALVIVGLALPLIVNAISISDTATRAIAQEASRHLGALFLRSGAFFALTGAAGFVAWTFGRGVRRLRLARGSRS